MPKAFFIIGDVDPAALETTQSNIANHILPDLSHSIDLVMWDACNLPLRSACIDRIITDLPFSKQVVRIRHAQQVLMPSTSTPSVPLSGMSVYESMMDESTRVLRYETGKAVMISADTMNITHNSKKVRFWGTDVVRKVMIGGMPGVIIATSMRERPHVDVSFWFPAFEFALDVDGNTADTPIHPRDADLCSAALTALSKEVCGDRVVESIELVDEFYQRESQRKSRCFRVYWCRSVAFDRTKWSPMLLLLRQALTSRFGVEIR
jgi:hypothetical protein